MNKNNTINYILLFDKINNQLYLGIVDDFKISSESYFIRVKDISDKFNLKPYSLFIEHDDNIDINEYNKEKDNFTIKYIQLVAKEIRIYLNGYYVDFVYYNRNELLKFLRYKFKKVHNLNDNIKFINENDNLLRIVYGSKYD